MITLVIGPGYTGSRVLERLPAASAIALGRSLEGREHLDLDSDAATIDLPGRYSIIFTVPPSADRASRSAPTGLATNRWSGSRTATATEPDRASRSAPTDARLASLLARCADVPQRFVYLSTTGVYGNRDAALVDETSEPHPESVQAQRRLAAETLLQDWSRERGTTPIILRVPGIYGPGRLGLDRIRAGTPVLDEEDANPGNRIHVDDLVTCCIAALSPDVPGGVYNVGDGDTRSTTWFTNEVARQATLPPPPTVSREEAERTFSPMRLSFLRESRIVDITKMRSTLGVHPKYTNPADGIAASLVFDSPSQAGSGDTFSRK